MKNNIVRIILILCLCTVVYAVWDKDKPASSTSLRSSNPEILANWSALETALTQDHEFSTGGANSGEHTQIKFNAPITKPTNAANRLFIYSKDVGSVVEVHILDESGNELQITSSGDLFSSTNLVITGTSTFNGSATLGAGDDLIGSSTSDITFNTDKFTVAGATGNTLVGGVLTITGGLADGSALAAATESGDGDRVIVDLNYAKTGDTVQHDSEGGFSNCDVDGTKTKVYTKYFTGTTDADSSTDVAHGISNALTKILHVSASVFNSGSNKFIHSDYRNGASINDTLSIDHDANSLRLTGLGTNFQSQVYRFKVDYIL